MNASDRALGLPEIVAIVLSHLSQLEDLILTPAAPTTELVRRNPSLLPCMLVSKLWADEASKLIWARQATLQHLLYVPSTRRQYYAQSIQSLRLPSTSTLSSSIDADQLNSLQWSRLRQLTMHVPMTHPNPVFVPARPFSFVPTPPTSCNVPGLKPSAEPDLAWRVSTIEKEYSVLESLEIHEDSSSHGPGRAEDVISFLEAHPTIKHVSLLSVASTRDGSVIKYLAARANLESLSIALDSCAPVLVPLPPGSFKELRSLSVMGRADDMTNLLAHLAHLRDLEITLLGNLGTSVTQNSINELLSAISRLQALSTLRVRTKIWGLLSTTQLILQGPLLVRLAQSCPRLKILDFDASSSPDASKVTDEEIGKIAQSLSSLEALRLPMKPWLSKLTWQALQSLGGFCRHMKSLRIGARIELGATELHQAILFPCLEDLTIGNPNRTAKRYAMLEQRVSNMLDQHFPKLKTVYVSEPAVAAKLLHESSLPVAGTHGLLSIDPSTDWDSRSQGRVGQGSYTLVARISFDHKLQPPKV